MKLSKIQKYELLWALRMEATAIEYGDKKLLRISVDDKGVTDRCPFCGRRHNHNSGAGHRLPHCANNIFGLPTKDVIFRNKSGELFFQADGYVIGP